MCIISMKYNSSQIPDRLVKKKKGKEHLAQIPKRFYKKHKYGYLFLRLNIFSILKNSKHSKQLMYNYELINIL